MSIFFIVSGMNLNVNALGTVGVIGVAYFLIRIAGKYLGTYFSCLAMGTSREIRKYMGLALIPQGRRRNPVWRFWDRGSCRRRREI